MKLLDMGEPRALLATALSPPSLSDIERTILLLKEVGLIFVIAGEKLRLFLVNFESFIIPISLRYSDFCK